MSRTVIFLDFNSYFASVEQHAQPHLRGRPIAVVPCVGDNTCCIAASVEAKHYGIKTGTSIPEARMRCPHVRFILSDPNKYIFYHHRLVRLIEEEIPIEQVMSIDELYGVFRGRFAERCEMEKIAITVKRRIAQEIGAPITCSIGLAPTVLLAKTASDMIKPDGLVWLHPSAMPARFFSLPIRDLCGVGVNMEARMHRHGIRTMQQLWQADVMKLRKVWGGIEGERFWQALHGVEPVRRAIITRQIGHSKVLPPELRYTAGAYAVLDRLTYRAAMRLRKAGYECGELTVYFSGKQNYWKSFVRFSSTCEVRIILNHWRQLWHERSNRDHEIYSVGMILSRLMPQGSPRLALFQEDPIEEKVSRLMEEVSAKHGSKALYFASSHAAIPEEVKRIAFSTIPE